MKELLPPQAVRDARRALSLWLLDETDAAPRPAWSVLRDELPPNLLPFAHRRLQAAGSLDELPAPLRARMEETARGGAALHLGLVGELRSAVRALATSDIPLVVLKGMALAHTVYPDPRLRSMADLDLLVPGERLAEARALLETSGLRIPKRREREAREASLEGWEGPLERPGTSRMVDLQTSLKLGQPPYSPRVVKQRELTEVFANTQTVEIAGASVRILGPIDTLRHVGLHLACMHGFQHGLRALIDLTLLVRQHAERLDWSRLAHDCGSLAPWMGLALTLVREDLGAAVPDDALAEFGDGPASHEVRELARLQVWESHRVHAPVGLLDLLAGHRTVLPARSPEAALKRVGAAGRRTGLDDLRRRLHVFGKTLARGHLGKGKLRHGIALRKSHWRMTDLMQRKP